MPRSSELGACTIKSRYASSDSLEGAQSSTFESDVRNTSKVAGDDVAES
jgi:hypothetical protein